MPSLTFDAQQQADFERGWPHLRVLTDAPPTKSVEGLFVEWPKATAAAWLRGFLAKPKADPIALKPGPAPSAAELKTGLAKAIALDPSPTFGDIENAVLLTEALLGPTATWDLVVPAVMKRKATSDCSWWINASGFLLLRMAPADRKKRVAALAAWAKKQDLDDSGVKPIVVLSALFQTGSSKLKVDLRQFKAELRHATKDPKAIVASLAGDSWRPTAFHSSRHFFLAGDEAAEQYLDYRWLNKDHDAARQLEILRHLAPLALPSALQLVGEMALRSKVKKEALAVLQAHPAEAKKALGAAAFKSVRANL